MSARSESVQNPKFMCHKKEQKQCKNQCVKLKIDIWPQRRAHSVNVWIETPCWDPHTVAENAANTIKICHCIYTWSIITHHTQASKVFKWMKECWLFLKAKTNKNAVKRNKKSKPVGFKGGVTISADPRRWQGERVRGAPRRWQGMRWLLVTRRPCHRLLLQSGGSSLASTASRRLRRRLLQHSGRFPRAFLVPSESNVRQ